MKHSYPRPVFERDMWEEFKIATNGKPYEVLQDLVATYVRLWREGEEVKE